MFAKVIRVLIIALGAASTVVADEAPGASDPATPPQRKLAKDPLGMKRLMPNHDAWVDAANKRVVVDGTVCLRAGQLEMFACLKGTKEHESIVAADTLAYAIHAALLAVGANPGMPAQFQPTYKSATGVEVAVTIVWTDEKGMTQHARAQDWIKNVKTGKAMEFPFVFAGSGFWTDSQTGEKRYLAESGDFICISNFPSAMLDVPVESSQSNDDLLFTAFTERIPPVGTRVRLVLTPKLKK